MRHIFTLLLFFLFSTFSLHSDIPAKEFETLIEKTRQEYNVPGAAVVIVKDDKIIFAQGFGIKEANNPDKVDADTIFQLASVSKTFTSAGLGVQVDQDKFKWDDEVIQHLPAAILFDPYATRYANSRDYLAHRTGLPAFSGNLLGELGLSRKDILKRIRYMEPVTSFRDKAHYSNINFFVAGQLLEELSGKTWEETIRSTLLDPLNMQRTGFADILDDKNLARPHAIINGKLQVIPWDKSIAFVAAGGVFSTANNLGNWMIMHLNEGLFEGKQVLKPETVKAIHTPAIVNEISFTDMPPINENSLLSYGLGWDVYQYHGKAIVEKAGALDGSRATITLIPELKLGIAVVANLNLTVFPELIRAKFLEQILGNDGKNIDTLFKEHQKKVDAIVERPQKPKDALPMAHSLGQYAGTYSNQLYGNIVITPVGQQLAFKAGPAEHTGRLIPWSNDTFLLSWPSIDAGSEFITFVFGPENKPVSFQTETLGNFKITESK